MTISRRLFIQMASIAAIAAGTMAKPSLAAFAQGINKPGATGTDPLANYTQETFTQYLNSIFRLHGSTSVDVTLQRVEDTLSLKELRGGGRESFVLHFRGDSVQLPQDTYTVEHPALGTFLLFLVPSGPDENGAQGYTATINRLAYSAKPGGARKPLSRKALTEPTPEIPTPGRPAPVTPETKSPGPAQGPAQAPTPKVQPRRRKVDPDLLPDFDS